MFGLCDTGYGMNLINLYYHHSVTERHPNLVQKFVHLKYLYYLGPFNIYELNGAKEIEQGKGGVDVTAVITYKTPFVVNLQQVIVSLALGEAVEFNTIFSWSFLKTMKASIMTVNNALVSGLLGYQFKL